MPQRRRGPQRGPHPTPLGARLRNARIDNDLTQAELGERVGISHAMVSGIETGKDRPSPKVAVRLARHLGLDVAEVLALAGYDTDRDQAAAAFEQAVWADPFLTEEARRRLVGTYRRLVGSG